MNKITISTILLILSANLFAQEAKTTAFSDNLMNISNDMDYSECRKFIGQDFWLLPGRSGNLFSEKINTYYFDKADYNPHYTYNADKYIIKTPLYNPSYEVTMEQYDNHYTAQTGLYRARLKINENNTGEGNKIFTLIDVWQDKEKISDLCEKIDAQVKSLSIGCSKPKEIDQQKIKELEKERNKIMKKENQQPFGHRDTRQSDALWYEINKLKNDNCEEYTLAYRFYCNTNCYNCRDKGAIMLVFKEKITGDTVYYRRYYVDVSGNINRDGEQDKVNLANSFVLIPYLAKQKELLENQYVICIKYHQKIAEDLETGKEIDVKRGDKLYCKQITAYDGTGGYTGLCYIFTTEQGNDIIIDERYKGNFQREDVYLEELLAIEEAKAQEQKAEQQKQKELEELRAKQQLERQKAEAQRKANYISKYGQADGELIFNKKVKIGFTTEMCRAAWGEPVNKTKRTTANGTYETWNYSGLFDMAFGSFRELHFINGKLVEIIE